MIGVPCFNAIVNEIGCEDYLCFTRPKSRAERNTSSKMELKLSPTPLSVSEVTEAEKRIVKLTIQ